MNRNITTLLAGAGLFGLWAALVFTGKTDAQPLVYAIGGCIASLGGYHAVTNLQATPKEPQQ